MNREIKFRAWDKVRKEYLSAGQILISIEPGRRPKLNNIYLDILKDANKYNDRFIIEQYTGLKDKNGKEIYEGDICKVKTVYMTEYEIYTVKQRYCGFRLFKNPHYAMCLCDMDERDIEVIGNIYENPELLKGGE